jgi:hypothetical protein
MERVKLTAGLRRSFARVLERQKLDALDQYYRQGFFDEVPLYSRYAELSFLDKYSKEEANALLLGLSLDYLDRVIRHDIPKAPFLAAITAWSCPKSEYLVPGIFVCHGQVDELLRGRLVLRPPKSAFASRIRSVVNETHGPDLYHVLQDTQTVPRDVRVFIAPRKLPSPMMVPIDELARTVHPGNGRATRA